MSSGAGPWVSTREHKLSLWGWWVALGGSSVLILTAFGFLLGYRYSPETYRTGPTIFGGVEIFWFGTVLVLAILAQVWFRNRDYASQRFVSACLPLAVVSVWVLGKTWVGTVIACYDVILFSAACGWVAVLLGRKIAAHRTSAPVEVSESVPVHSIGRLPSFDLSRWAGWVLAFVTAGLGVYYICQQIWYLNNLALGFSDLGEIARVMHNTWNNPRELFLRENPERPLFFDHFQPGIVPFIPFWLLWPRLELLIIFQVIALLSPVLPLYWIGNRVFRDKIAGLLLAAAWLVYPSTSQFIFNSSLGFRWGDFCLPLYFFALAFWLKGRFGWALAAAAWAVLIKEEAAILVGMFGVYLALFQRPRRIGVCLAMGAFSYFLLISSVVVPALAGGSYGYIVQRYFSELGSTKWEILLSPLTKPTVFWGRLFESTTFYFVATLLSPLLFLPLKKPSVLFIGSLTFLFVSLFDSHWMVKSICLQYQAGLLPVIFWALVRVLQDDPAESSAIRRRATLAGAVMAGLTLSIFFGNTFWSKETLPIQIFPGRLSLVERMGANIDRNGTLVASQRIAAHFIEQKYLFLPFHLPPETDSVFIDLYDHWRPTPGVDSLREGRAYQRKVEARADLHLVAAEDGLLLYARQGQPLDARALVERRTLPSDIISSKMDLGNGVTIVGYVVTLLPPKKHEKLARLRVRAYSQITIPTHVDLALRCILRFYGNKGDEEMYASEYLPMGQAIWSIERWEVGKYYMDERIITLPSGLGGQRFVVGFESRVLSERVPASGEPNHHQIRK